MEPILNSRSWRVRSTSLAAFGSGVLLVDAVKDVDAEKERGEYGPVLIYKAGTY